MLSFHPMRLAFELFRSLCTLLGAAVISLALLIGSLDIWDKFLLLKGGGPCVYCRGPKRNRNENFCARCKPKDSYRDYRPMPLAWQETSNIER